MKTFTKLFERCRIYHGENMRENDARLREDLRLLLSTPEGAAIIETLRARRELCLNIMGEASVFRDAMQLAHYSGKQEALSEIIQIMDGI